MPEKPKKKPGVGNSKTEEPEKDSWSEDQKTREYYYDDAYGYDAYDPEDDDKEEAN